MGVDEFVIVQDEANVEGLRVQMSVEAGEEFRLKL